MIIYKTIKKNYSRENFYSSYENLKDEVSFRIYNLIGKYNRNVEEACLEMVADWKIFSRDTFESRYILGKNERATSGDNGGPQGEIIYPRGRVPKKSYSPRKFGPTCAIPTPWPVGSPQVWKARSSRENNFIIFGNFLIWHASVAKNEDEISRSSRCPISFPFDCTSPGGIF